VTILQMKMACKHISLQKSSRVVSRDLIMGADVPESGLQSSQLSNTASA